MLCARDEWVQATPQNAATLDFIWVRGATPGWFSKSLAKLPFQGSRFYHACAVRFMLQQHLIQYADLGLGIRASGRLPQGVFRAPLDRIEEALPRGAAQRGDQPVAGQSHVRSVKVRSVHRAAPRCSDALCRRALHA